MGVLRVPLRSTVDRPRLAGKEVATPKQRKLSSARRTQPLLVGFRVHRISPCKSRTQSPWVVFASCIFRGHDVMFVLFRDVRTYLVDRPRAAHRRQPRQVSSNKVAAKPRRGQANLIKPKKLEFDAGH
jgi:hypothetical protein